MSAFQDYTLQDRSETCDFLQGFADALQVEVCGICCCSPSDIATSSAATV